MVKVSSAGGGVQDSFTVGLEHASVSLDGDGEWLSSKGGLHLHHTVFPDVGVISDNDISLAKLIVLAVAIQSSVWVYGLKLSVVFFVVLEGLGLPATVASVVMDGAVHKLLLREGKELSSGDLVSTLERTSGGKGPA